MTQVLLGTKNPGKIAEALGILSGLPGIRWRTHADCPFSDVEETGSSFLENALQKAAAIGGETGLPVLSEDAGLEVSALGGEPGVRSARYRRPDVPRNNALLERPTRRSTGAVRRGRGADFPTGRRSCAPGSCVTDRDSPRGTVASATTRAVPAGATKTAEMTLPGRTGRHAGAIGRMRTVGRSACVGDLAAAGRTSANSSRAFF
jgi:hypothetical protein